MRGKERSVRSGPQQHYSGQPFLQKLVVFRRRHDCGHSQQLQRSRDYSDSRPSVQARAQRGWRAGGPSVGCAPTGAPANVKGPVAIASQRSRSMWAFCCGGEHVGFLLRRRACGELSRQACRRGPSQVKRRGGGLYGVWAVWAQECSFLFWRPDKYCSWVTAFARRKHENCLPITISIETRIWKLLSGVVEAQSHFQSQCDNVN